MRPPPPEQIYLPFETGPYRMAMGLVAVPAAEWFVLDARYPDEMAERRRLLAERHDDVFGVLPEAEDASREVLQRLVAYLTAQFPDWFSLDGSRLSNRLTGESWNLADPPCHPLELAGRLVQDDLCIIQSERVMRRPASLGPCYAFPAAGACTKSWDVRLRRCMDRYRITPTAWRPRSIASWRR